MQLLLFSTDEAVVDATAKVIDGLVVDWERLGKSRRQVGADTHISEDKPHDLWRVRRQYDGLIVVRINNAPSDMRSEINLACRLGADEVLVPMVRNESEVETALDLARGRVGVGVMIETPEALGIAAALDALPVTRFFVGLNDLAICQRRSNIFEPVVDGTISALRASINSKPFGFGGLTDPDLGWPIPNCLLLAAMVDGGCDFTFLRRSFLRDVNGRDPAQVVAKIRDAVVHAQQLTVPQRQTAVAEFAAYTEDLAPNAELVRA